MILRNPYNSSLQKLVNMDKIDVGVNRYIVLNYSYIKSQEKKQDVSLKAFEGVNYDLNPVGLYGISDVEGDIPSFAHPYISVKHKWIAMDLRPYVVPDKGEGNFKIRNNAEFDLQVTRWIMSGMYATGHENILYGLKFPHFVFSDWIADSLTHKFGLGLGDQLRIKVAALVYYTTMFNDNDLGGDDLEKLLIRTAKQVAVPELVKEIFEKVKGVKNIGEFASVLEAVTGNVRLGGLDLNGMINIFSNSWYGTSGKEMSILALEHPPTWIALVYMSLIERSFKRSTVATQSNKNNKRGSGPEFISSLTGIMSGYRDDGVDLGF